MNKLTSTCIILVMIHYQCGNISLKMSPQGHTARCVPRAPPGAVSTYQKGPTVCRVRGNRSNEALRTPATWANLGAYRVSSQQKSDITCRSTLSERRYLMIFLSFWSSRHLKLLNFQSWYLYVFLRKSVTAIMIFR